MAALPRSGPPATMRAFTALTLLFFLLAGLPTCLCEKGGPLGAAAALASATGGAGCGCGELACAGGGDPAPGARDGEGCGCAETCAHSCCGHAAFESPSAAPPLPSETLAGLLPGPRASRPEPALLPSLERPPRA